MEALVHQKVFSANPSDPDAQFSCDFCPLYFGDRSDRNAHILDHFVKKTCTDCNKNIVQIGDDWYELHVDIKLSNVKCEPPLDIENETVPTEYGEIIADPDCDSLYLDGESLSDVPAGSSMHTEMNEHNLDDAADISSTDANFESIKYICAYCHVNFNMERTLRRHILREHNSETTQYCRTCSESFKNPYSLLNHMEANHKFLPPINLSVDQADVDEKFVIMNLNDIQSKSNRTCRFCKRTFQSIGHMKDHIRVHTGEKPFSCRICGVSFTQLGSAIKHERTLHLTLPYKCELSGCSEEFALKTQLRKHRIANHPETIEKKILSCTHCGEQFRSEYQLRIHKNIHGFATPYTCPICNDRFSSPDDLLRHKKLKHGTPKVDTNKFYCSIKRCKQQFATKIERDNHLLVHKSRSKGTPRSGQNIP